MNRQNYQNCLKFWNQNFLITKNLIGRRVLVHNGYKFFSMLIRKNMINFKLGDFILTKKIGPTIHTKKKRGSKKR